MRLPEWPFIALIYGPVSWQAPAVLLDDRSVSIPAAFLCLLGALTRLRFGVFANRSGRLSHPRDFAEWGLVCILEIPPKPLFMESSPFISI